MYAILSSGCRLPSCLFFNVPAGSEDIENHHKKLWGLFQFYIISIFHNDWKKMPSFLFFTINVRVEFHWCKLRTEISVYHFGTPFENVFHVFWGQLFRKTDMNWSRCFSETSVVCVSDPGLLQQKKKRKHMNRDMSKPTKWLCAQPRCPGWSESSLGTQSLCWFCHVAAHMALNIPNHISGLAKTKEANKYVHFIFWYYQFIERTAKSFPYIRQGR